MVLMSVDKATCDEQDKQTTPLKTSASIERLLYDLGSNLHKSLLLAGRIDEVEAIMSIIFEYDELASEYGEATGRIPESLAVDLTEAALLKRDELISGVHQEWLVYATQFETSLSRIVRDSR